MGMSPSKTRAKRAKYLADRGLAEPGAKGAEKVTATDSDEPTAGKAKAKKPSRRRSTTKND